MALLAELCQRWDAVVVTDEVDEHLQYLGPGGHLPASPPTRPGAAAGSAARCRKRWETLRLAKLAS